MSSGFSQGADRQEDQKKWTTFCHREHFLVYEKCKRCQGENSWINFLFSKENSSRVRFVGVYLYQNSRRLQCIRDSKKSPTRRTHGQYFLSHLPKHQCYKFVKIRWIGVTKINTRALREAATFVNVNSPQHG